MSEIEHDDADFTPDEEEIKKAEALTSRRCFDCGAPIVLETVRCQEHYDEAIARTRAMFGTISRADVLALAERLQEYIIKAGRPVTRAEAASKLGLSAQARLLSAAERHVIERGSILRTSAGLVAASADEAEPEPNAPEPVESAPDEPARSPGDQPERRTCEVEDCSASWTGRGNLCAKHADSDRAPALARRIVVAIHEGDNRVATRPVLAAALGLTRDSRAFRGAMSHALDHGLIIRVGQGYRTPRALDDPEVAALALARLAVEGKARPEIMQALDLNHTEWVRAVKIARERGWLVDGQGVLAAGPVPLPDDAPEAAAA